MRLFRPINVFCDSEFSAVIDSLLIAGMMSGRAIALNAKQN